MPAARARRFNAASRSAIGCAWVRSLSPPGYSMSLITSMSTSASGASSGALPCRSGFFAGFTLSIVPSDAIASDLGGPRASEEHAGHTPGRLAVLQRHLAIDDGGGNAFRLLHEAA